MGRTVSAVDFSIKFCYSSGMAQHLVNRRGYWSLEQSYREGRKVKKRRLAYYGRNKPFNIFTDVDWAFTLKGDGKWANFEPPSTVAPATPSALPPGLCVGPADPVPIDKPMSQVIVPNSPAAASPAEPAAAEAEPDEVPAPSDAPGASGTPF
jgi:hypothetical protein